MKTFYKQLVVLSIMCTATLSNSQELENDAIYYQGVARNAEGKIMTNEELSICISLRFGAPEAPVAYKETHYVTTTAMGVYRLSIGDGSEVLIPYKAPEWIGLTTFLTIAINGAEGGAAEIMTVPYVIYSGNKTFLKVWIDKISNQNKCSIRYKFERSYK